ncbi:VIT1/CCC1 transporter family protein [Jatrophihabitans telluris]|uniref:VIT1/CCC1 transporter family protein n=1 Tax=Jatrophihabitans telluris TaxID=2038343 RepID=A0ABY4QWG4_9ACTN|nr:VIT1/CCC1 transporter family protein [Jatrophihabitans telluris]UQX87151.1 VIT1/CCC1 transporter family protein [Jatrophihabitans telluris]
MTKGLPISAPTPEPHPAPLPGRSSLSNTGEQRESHRAPHDLAHPLGHDHEIGHEHRDVSGGWLRPAVFGMVDGLVSNFGLIAGVAAASSGAKSVMIAGVAGLFAGAFSMGTGEYISVRSQNESMQAEVDVERDELTYNAEAELAELTQIYINRGVDPELAQLVAEQLSHDPEQALEIHAQEELGVDIHDLPNPWQAMISSFLSFSVGAVLPLLPFLFGADLLWLAALLTLTGLFVTGALTSRFTSKAWWYASGRQVLLGVVTFVVTYSIGHLVGANVS